MCVGGLRRGSAPGVCAGGGDVARRSSRPLKTGVLIKISIFCTSKLKSSFVMEETEVSRKTAAKCISPSLIGDNPETVIGHFQDDTI